MSITPFYQNSIICDQINELNQSVIKRFMSTMGVLPTQVNEQSIVRLLVLVPPKLFL